jgi:elongation factor G
MSGKIGAALLTLAVTPSTTAAQHRLGRGLDALMAEDPTISVSRGQATGEMVIGGMGELHLEIVIDRLKREFRVEASVGRPTVACKEILTRPADGQAKYAGQMAGRAQYAHVKIHLYPGEPGSGYVFENAIVSDAIPAQFVKPVDEGIAHALTCGVLAGCPVADVHAVLCMGASASRSL